MSQPSSFLAIWDKILQNWFICALVWPQLWSIYTRLIVGKVWIRATAFLILPFEIKPLYHDACAITILLKKGYSVLLNYRLVTKKSLAFLGVWEPQSVHTLECGNQGGLTHFPWTGSSRVQSSLKSYHLGKLGNNISHFLCADYWHSKQEELTMCNTEFWKFTKLKEGVQYFPRHIFSSELSKLQLISAQEFDTIEQSLHSQELPAWNILGTG